MAGQGTAGERRGRVGNPMTAQIPAAAGSEPSALLGTSRSVDDSTELVRHESAQLVQLKMPDV